MKAHAVEVRPGPLQGTVAAPPSKSLTHRAFLLAAQSDAPCTVRGPLLADDTRATLACLLALGARVHLDPDRPEAVQFLPAPLRPGAQALDCRNSGTTLRLLTATAARFGQPVTLTGDDSLRARPNAGLHDALRTLGASVSAGSDGRAPVTVRGPMRPGAVRLAGATSSQFASALLLDLPLLPAPSSLVLDGPVSSAPYLDLTLDVAHAFGLRIQRQGARFDVAGADTPRAPSFAVEGDWSSAAFVLAAAAVTRGSVAVRGLRSDSRQGDRALLQHLARFGAKVASAGGVTVTGADLDSPGPLDVAATPDLFPVLAVVAACARGTTTFTGGAALRHKESDRIAAMADGLRRLGARVEERPDGLVVHGSQTLRGTTLSAHGDHRVHMALCVAALAAQGPSVIDGPATAAVSHPGFHADLAALGADVRLLQGNRTVVAS